MHTTTASLASHHIETLSLLSRNKYRRTLLKQLIIHKCIANRQVVIICKCGHKALYRCTFIHANHNLFSFRLIHLILDNF